MVLRMSLMVSLKGRSRSSPTSHSKVVVLRFHKHSKLAVLAFSELNTLAPRLVCLQLFYLSVQTYWLLTFHDDAKLSLRVSLNLHSY